MKIGMRFGTLELEWFSKPIESILTVSVLLIVQTTGWPTYRFSIPNGKNVPNPCEQNTIWTAVGHNRPKVFGPRNPFGEDFLKYGLNWNPRICMTDSDGDGRTNGEELGDPTCEWRKSRPTPLLPSVSHPGICEPMDSPLCMQRQGQYRCPGAKHFKCPAFTRNDTLQLNVSMERTHIPVKVSSYVCLEVRLPFDKDYHLLAAKPRIDKIKHVDQIQIFACDSGLHSRVYNHPFECGEKPRGDCQSLIGGFSRNEPGICFAENTGIKIGATGCRQIIFQIRYNNPLLNQALYDNSGINLHYTSNLQPFELGIKLISVTHFTIPPGSKNAAITAEYPQQCSAAQISNPIFITGAFIHMHKFGREQRVELVRNGIVTEIVREGNDFRAHHLNGNHLKKPIKVLPGDSIRIACWYDTSSAKTPITWGLLSTNEMCSASLMFYPRMNWLQATGTSFKKIPLCKLQTSGEVNGCRFGRLFEAVSQKDTTAVHLAQCARDKICTEKCFSIASLAFNHPCLKGENYELLQSRLTRKFQKLKNFLDTLQLCSMKMQTNTTHDFDMNMVTGIPTIIPDTLPSIQENFSSILIPKIHPDMYRKPPPPSSPKLRHMGHTRPSSKPKIHPIQLLTSSRNMLQRPKLQPQLSNQVHFQMRNNPTSTNTVTPRTRSVHTSNMFAQDPLFAKLATIMKLIRPQPVQ